MVNNKSKVEETSTSETSGLTLIIRGEHVLASFQSFNICMWDAVFYLLPFAHFLRIGDEKAEIIVYLIKAAISIS